MISRFLVPQLFLGLFLRKLDIQDFRKLAEQLPWRLPELDGQPQVATDVPKNAPPDAIRARFMSADQRKVLEVAPAKLQFRMLPGELVEQNPGGPRGLRPGTLSESFDAFIPQAMKIHSVFNEHFGATAVRIGLLTELFVPVNASSNQRMQKALLSSANHFGDRLQELQIQALAKPVLDGDRVVNRWIRVKPLRSSDERQADLAMGVEVDINTLPEDNYDLTTADIEGFLRNVKKHIEEKVPLFQDSSLIEE
ncbi:hypothetical protein IT571_10485 [Candidatus Sumerlaeota bacterium]|nr:hypothetical protein [Candidatus Sumerlaeota bacterium]HNM45445.1 hypothetical protein [Candidatus Sumerlaeota bacterium]